MKNTETIANILKSVKGFFLLPEDATEAEVHQKLVDAEGEVKANLVLEMATQIADLVQSETTKQVEDFTAKLQTEVDGIIGEFRTQIAGFEKQLSEKSEGVTIEQVDSKIDALKTEIGNEINTIKLSKGIASANGDPKIVQTHEPTKKQPVTRVLGTYPEA